MKKAPEASVLDRIVGIESLENRCLNSFINPYSYLVVRKRFFGIDRWFVDGQFSVWLLNALGFNVTRKSFDMTSLAPEIFRFCEQNTKSLVFIGASTEDVEKFVDVVLDNYPKLKILFYRNGFFDCNSDLESTQRRIVEDNPDFVICGMGAGKQEEFLMKLRESGWFGTGYTCGGFIHQTASAGIKYYPTWADRLHLRWLYRMIDEPKLIKRYFKYYPIFPLFLIYDFLKNKS
ncbi:MAG TPA: glycosyltransferase [Gammaproteobacteria bacterium]|nr:glycosyltransferase [Gammaproteobacteria bacterium]|tara:strand:- start:662 stop:1360 length:699 start_codon:yes stop_codon:yes gene_type:complete